MPRTYDDLAGPEAGLADEVQLIADRVLAAIKLLDPVAYHKIRRTTSSVVVVTGDFRLMATDVGDIVVTDINRGGPWADVFHILLDPTTGRVGERAVYWDAQVCREFVVPALDRVLVLEDLASI